MIITKLAMSGRLLKLIAISRLPDWQRHECSRRCMCNGVVYLWSLWSARTGRWYLACGSARRDTRPTWIHSVRTVSCLFIGQFALSAAQPIALPIIVLIIWSIPLSRLMEGNSGADSAPSLSSWSIRPDATVLRPDLRPGCWGNVRPLRGNEFDLKPVEKSCDLKGNAGDTKLLILCDLTLLGFAQRSLPTSFSDYFNSVIVIIRKLFSKSVYDSN